MDRARPSAGRGLHRLSRQSAIGRRSARSSAGCIAAADLKLPKFVSLSSEYNEELQTFEDPGYVGAAHRAFIPTRKGLDNFALRPEITLDRLGDRKQLLQSLDNVRRDLDSGEFAALDAFTAQALDMITSRNVREAFDLEREPRELMDRYGHKGANSNTTSLL